MLTPKHSQELIAALERRGVKLGRFTREIVEDLAGVLEALEDELVDLGNKPSTAGAELGAAIAEVLAAPAQLTIAAAMGKSVPGSMCGPQCWGCKQRLGGIHIGPLTDQAGGGK